MAKRKPMHKHWNWCDFGEHAIAEDAATGRYHVYPIPACNAFPDGGMNGHGGTACGECYPAIYDLQVEQGIMLIDMIE